MSNHIRKPSALQGMIDYALSKPVQVGWVLEAGLNPDGSMKALSRSTIGFLLDELWRQSADWDFSQIRHDRAYIAVHHPEGCYVVEL